MTRTVRQTTDSAPPGAASSRGTAALSRRLATLDEGRSKAQ
ncbi:hypothetical protein [Streptomyces buecherae]